MRFVHLIIGMGVIASLALWPAVSAWPAVSGSPLPAVWKERHLNFFYRGRTSRYSCDGLHDKVRALLLDLGARRDIKITAVGCEPSTPRFRPGSLGPSLSIVFSSPALPDAAAKPAGPGDLSAVDARFEAFTITNDAFRNMGVGDCELVEEFARQVLPKLATRNLSKDITCAQNQPSGSRFLVRGEVLRTLPWGEAANGSQRSETSH